MDALENKLLGQDQANRNTMDQVMKLSQELKVIGDDFIIIIFFVTRQ